jgi:hypothetical protein
MRAADAALFHRTGGLPAGTESHHRGKGSP